MFVSIAASGRAARCQLSFLTVPIESQGSYLPLVTACALVRATKSRATQEARGEAHFAQETNSEGCGGAVAGISACRGDGRADSGEPRTAFRSAGYPHGK